MKNLTITCGTEHEPLQIPAEKKVCITFHIRLRFKMIPRHLNTSSRTHIKPSNTMDHNDVD